jgi:hypothetical protein
MAYLTHLSRLFIAAGFLAAAMLFATSGAQAHAGHRHGPVNVEHPVSKPNVQGEVRTGDKLMRARLDAGDSVWTAKSDVPNREGATICGGGCCHPAGQGCCAAALPVLIAVVPPPAASERFLTSLLWGPGTTPGVPPEPPRHLV